MKQDTFNVDNKNGIGLMAHHTLTSISDGKQRWMGDDVLTLQIENFRDYDTDLTIGSDLYLQFDKAQARRFGWLLIRLAGRMKSAEERSMDEVTGLPILPPELEKAWRK